MLLAAKQKDEGSTESSLADCLGQIPTLGKRICIDQIPPERGCCRLVPGMFTETECLSFIRHAQSRGYSKASPSYPPSYRNNGRLVVDDYEFAARVFQRVKDFLPQIVTDADGTKWKLVGINERFRLCRYEAGQFFKIHRDGVYHRNSNVQSKLTFMVYLNDQAAFEGGLTRFFETRDPQSKVLASIAPVTGALIYFDHDLWHDGQELSGGEKFIMRSDILYERIPSKEVDSVNSSALQQGHSGYVWTLAELPNGMIATGGRDKTVKLWKQNQSCVETLQGHDNSVTAIIAVTSNELWSASRDQTIRIWKFSTDHFESHQTLRGHRGAVLSLAKSEDNSTIASGSADQTICFWRLDGSHRATLVGHTDWVWKVQFLSRSILASVSEDGTLSLWSLQSGDCVSTFTNGDSPLRTLCISPNKQQIAVGSADGMISLWSVVQSDGGGTIDLRLANKFYAHAGEVRALEFLTDDQLVSGAEDDHVKLWSLSSCTLLQSGTHKDFVTSLTRLSNGSLMSTSYDGHIKSWDFSQKVEVL